MKNLELDNLPEGFEKKLDELAQDAGVKDFKQIQDEVEDTILKHHDVLVCEGIVDVAFLLGQKGIDPKNIMLGMCMAAGYISSMLTKQGEDPIDGICEVVKHYYYNAVPVRDKVLKKFDAENIVIKKEE